MGCELPEVAGRLAWGLGDVKLSKGVGGSGVEPGVPAEALTAQRKRRREGGAARLQGTCGSRGGGCYAEAFPSPVLGLGCLMGSLARPWANWQASDCCCARAAWPPWGRSGGARAQCPAPRTKSS